MSDYHIDDACRQIIMIAHDDQTNYTEKVAEIKFIICDLIRLMRELDESQP